MRLGATNVSWRTKKKDVRMRHVLNGHFPPRSQVQLDPDMLRRVERTGTERDEEGAKERAG